MSDWVALGRLSWPFVRLFHLPPLTLPTPFVSFVTPISFILGSYPFSVDVPLLRFLPIPVWVFLRPFGSLDFFCLYWKSVCPFFGMEKYMLVVAHSAHGGPNTYLIIRSEFDWSHIWVRRRDED
ncbi:hypothetical protein BDM02DRAFT_2570527 [Thelephora ganbajun]|uniref:Uncharacterized protein n=1 Tax=Thelephora ganbajun TaxID=370292 RepID=A0ACB6ZUF6_THEGA|nr:hypothetical protein BDM02DRAFT_2570527 [Thelephora ganbajun]